MTDEERLRKIKGPDGQWEVEKFVGADLQGRVDVIAEAGSSTPRSTLADRAEVEQLMGYGIVNRFDPETQEKILAMYGKTHWLGSMSLDSKNAVIEDEQFEQIAQNPIWQGAGPADVQAIQMAPDYPTAVALMETWASGVPQLAMDPTQKIEWPKVYAALDNHAIHSLTHARTCKKQTFRQWPEIVQAMLEKHQAFHDQLSIQQAAALQGGGAAPMTPAFAAGGGGGGGSQPMNSSSSPARIGNRTSRRAVTRCPAATVLKSASPTRPTVGSRSRDRRSPNRSRKSIWWLPIAFSF